jgi:hypothetical protein
MPSYTEQEAQKQREVTLYGVPDSFNFRDPGISGEVCVG